MSLTHVGTKLSALRGLVLMLGAAAAAIVFLAVSWPWRWLRRYAPFRRMEMAMPGPSSLPFLRTALIVTSTGKKNTILAKLLELWGGCCSELTRFSVGNQLFVFVSDADHLGKVMRDRRFIDKPSIAYSFLNGLLGEGIFVSNGATWQQDRTMMTPTFHLEVLSSFFDVFHEEAQAFVRRIAPKSGCDFLFGDELFRATCVSAIRTTLTSTLDDKDREDLDTFIKGLDGYMKILKNRLYNPVLWSDTVFSWTSMGRKHRKYETVLNELIGRIISRKRSEIESTKELHEMQSTRKFGYKNFKSLLDLVVEGSMSGEMNLTQDKILTTSKTIFGTAVDTPVIVLGFVFKILSIRPDVQERAYAEIKEITQGSNRQLNIDDIPRLVYLERVIKETLRIFPVGPLMARQCKEDCELAGKSIPAGTVLVLNIIGAHRDPRHHQDPLRFDPDRFLPERLEKMHPFSFLPFSAGPRNCIGQQYAMMLLKTLTAVTLRAYCILPVSDGITEPSQFPITFDVVLRYVHGVKVRFDPRLADQSTPSQA